jgi:tryptophan synthase alpha chain
LNRIDKKFTELKLNKSKAFIAFITAGDPDLATTEKLVLELEAQGVDIIELGVPFSGPLADGPTIQASYHRSLSNGTTLKKIIDTVKVVRGKTNIPIALMSSYNPIFRFGQEKFINACSQAGVDGLIIPDLPPEEATSLIAQAQAKDISTIFFVAPTTQDDRIKANTKATTGFVYYVSLTGITGTQKAVSKAVVERIKHIKRFTTKPVCAGFGISSPEQVKEIGAAADGVIVGSTIVKKIAEHQADSLVPAIGRYVSSLVKALR